MKALTSIRKQIGPTLNDWSRRARWAEYRHRLLHSTKPILVGPFRSEVGFEALYWLPFLDKLVMDGVERDRLIPISRGGAACWYGTPQGLELYAMRTPQQVRVENTLQQRTTGLLKQIRVTEFDRGVLLDAAHTLGLADYHVLHPSWMYTLLAPYWETYRGLGWLQQRTAWSVMAAPPLPDGITIPEHAVAMRFYLRPTFRGSDQASGLIAATVKHIAAEYPVVLLHHDLHLDDHLDITISKIKNVTLLRDLVASTPETNLAVQSAILARCDAFVGTYGGFAQLALRLARPVCSYFDTWGATSIAHRHLAEAFALQIHVPFQTLALGELPFLHAMVPVPEKRPHLAPQPEPVGVG